MVFFVEVKIKARLTRRHVKAYPTINQNPVIFLDFAKRKNKQIGRRLEK